MSDPKGSQPQPLPHSEETERALGACVLLRPELFPILRAKMTPPERVIHKRSATPADMKRADRDNEAAMFYLDRSKSAWSAFCAISDANLGIDLRTLQTQMQADETFEESGGLAYFAGLDLDMPDLSGYESYAGIVRDLYRKRLLLDLSDATMRRVFSDSPVDIMVSETSTELDSIAKLSTASAGELCLDDQLQEALPAEEGTADSFLTSSLGDLDAYRLFRPGTLTSIAGRPGHAKSVLVAQIAEHVAMRENRRVILFHLEMVSSAVWQRLASNHCDVDYGDYQAANRRGRLGPRERTRIVEYFGRVADNGLIEIKDEPSRTIDEIRTASMVAHAEEPLGMVVIDHLGLINYLNPYEERINYGQATRVFHNLSKELGIAVVVLCQMNRKIYDRPGWIPRTVDIASADVIVHNSDGIVMLSYPFKFEEEVKGEGEVDEAEHPPNQFFAYVQKNRGGKTGSMILDFNGSRQRLRGLDRTGRSWQ